MPYKFFNPNPKFQRVGDCVVRAICKAIGVDWQEAYISLCAEGLSCKDMPSANYVWGRLLNRYGDSEFLAAISDKNAEGIWMLMDELMETLRALNPRLYQATIDRIKTQ